MELIGLTQGKFAQVDDEDFDRLVAHRWRASKIGNHWYAQASVKQPDGSWKTMYMHRFILGSPKGLQIDHVDGDGLNNRRSNLRHATAIQNNWNRHSASGESQFVGVSRNGSGWRALIAVNGRQFNVGTFETQADAAKAYDAVARLTRGEFAGLNFPESKEAA